MKAEHRKELQTNVLASSIAKLIEGAKSKPNTRTIVIVGVVVVVIGLIVGWRYYSNRNKEQLSGNWRKLYDATTPEAVAEVAQQARGTDAGLVAEIREARLELKKGLDGLGTPRGHAAAVKSITEAGEKYERLAGQKKLPPPLIQEALLNAGKARESLGDLDGALTHYEKLAQTYPKSDAGKMAAERVAKIKSERDQVKSFYQRLVEDLTKRS